MTITTKELSYGKPTWCPGCGHFAVLNALQRAIIELGLKKENIACVTGIGCSSKLSEYLDTYGYHTIHGRSIPSAAGVKLANPGLEVIAAGGDGDGFAIGCGHFVHAVRRNIDITYILMNNQVYSLTKGQTSPTSDRGFVTKTSPDGAEETPINPLLLALAAGASFVASGFSSDVAGLSKIIAAGIRHKGFSFINVMSPCVTFNKLNTYDWYKRNTYNIEESESELDSGIKYNPKSYEFAMEVAMNFFIRKPVGILFDVEVPVFKETWLSQYPVAPANQQINDISQYHKLMKQYCRE